MGHQLLNKKVDTITVYWAPGQFTSSERFSWNQFYSAPTPVYSSILSERNPEASSRAIFGCPAYSESMKNLFEIRSVHEEHVAIPEIFFTNPPSTFPTRLPLDSYLSFELPRASSLKNYIDLAYNMSWLFFSEEPLLAKFTAPYFPPKTPAKGAALAMGEFDIGLWFRNFNLDYMVPTGSTEFNIDINDPLFYVQFFTEKQIVFKRFIHTDVTQKLVEEFAQSSNRRGKKMGISFSNRYDLSRKTMLPNLVLNEIKKNVVE
jgi:hypothetical protein